MAADDCLLVELPTEFADGPVSGLLGRAFPADEGERQDIAARFDLRANPDLPDIYAVFLAVCEEWRDWRCALRIMSAGKEVGLDALASGLLRPLSEPQLLSLRLEQQYRPMKYAVRHGYWESRAGLLTWLRSLTALYFLDKHEVELRADEAPSLHAPGLTDAVESLLSQGLIALEAPSEPEGGVSPAGDTARYGITYGITGEGRRFIGETLAETESYIDLYDHYQDTLTDPDGELVEFGSGRGADLRVEAFLAEGLDPIRTVFLLRLYDGTLDARLRDWTEVIESEEYFEAVLEPVVNRYSLPPEAMEQVMEAGYTWLETQQEQARLDHQRQEVLRRVGGEPH